MILRPSVSKLLSWKKIVLIVNMNIMVKLHYVLQGIIFY